MTPMIATTTLLLVCALLTATFSQDGLTLGKFFINSGILLRTSVFYALAGVVWVLILGDVGGMTSVIHGAIAGGLITDTVGCIALAFAMGEDT